MELGEAEAGNLSRPARGAWIEMPKNPLLERPGAVAPRTGRVD